MDFVLGFPIPTSHDRERLIGIKHTRTRPSEDLSRASEQHLDTCEAIFNAASLRDVKGIKLALHDPRNERIVFAVKGVPVVLLMFFIAFMQVCGAASSRASWVANDAGAQVPPQTAFNFVGCHLANASI